MFLACDLLVELCVFDGNGDLRCQRRDGSFVVFVEKAASRVLQIEHADDLVFVNERYDQFGMGLGVERNVARIFTHIRYQHGLLLLRSIADNTSAERNVVFQLDILVEAHRKAMLQLLPGSIE